MKTNFLIVILFCTLLRSAFALADLAILSTAPGYQAFLTTNQHLVSPSGKVTLVMQQDGNLVMYLSECGVGKPQCSIWNSKTAQQHGQYVLAMQADGNLVVYQGNPQSLGAAIWNTQTVGPSANYHLVLQDDENLVIYKGAGPLDNQGAVWSRKYGVITSGNSKSDGRIKLGWTNITPCSKMEWRRHFPESKIADQRLYAFAYVDKSWLNSAKVDIEQCAVQAVAACGIASLIQSPVACTPAFKFQLTECLNQRGVDSKLAQSLKLNVESRCEW